MVYLKAKQADALPQTVTTQLTQVRAAGKTIVLVTGVFDLFHEEHQQFLANAKERGDFLVVGLESDARVRALKGSGRPVQSEAERWQQLTDNSAADLAFVLPDDFSLPQHHRALIKSIQPQFLAVSSHSPHLDKKQAILAEFGGQVVVVHQHNPAISTSQLIAQQR